MSASRPFLAAGLLALLLGGCARPEASPSPRAPADAREERLVDVAGDGPGVTTAFDSKSRAIRIDYRFSARPSGGQASFTLERETGNGLFEEVSRLDLNASESLGGSRRLAVNRGRYRLRVACDVPWSAQVYGS